MPELKSKCLDNCEMLGKFKEPSKQKKEKLVKNGAVKSNSLIPRINSTHRIENIQESSDEQITKRKPKFLVRKSYSQMDMKQSTKNDNRFQQKSVDEKHSSIVLPKPVRIQTPTTSPKNIFHPTKENMCYVLADPDKGNMPARVAGMKMFATIMLNAWRNRTEDVRRLNNELDTLQKRFIKVKNQVHVLNSVFRYEQKLNEKLKGQLRNAGDEHQRIRSTVDSLTTSLIKAETDGSLLEQQLHAKDLENETMSYTLTETNSKLFKSMAQIRQIQISLSCEQRNVQLLENQKNELLNEITLHELKCKQMEEQHSIKMSLKDQDLLKANAEIKILDTLLLDLKEKEFQVRNLRKIELNLKTEIDSLKFINQSLQVELSKCFTARMKSFWGHYLAIHNNTLMLVHICAFHLLPALPPPRTTKMPFRIGLKKFMSLKRH